MMERALAAWKSLYDVVDSFRQLEPWTFLYSDQLCAIVPQDEEFWGCTVLGSAGMERGLTLRSGQRAVENYIQMMDERTSEPMRRFLQRDAEQTLIFWSDREELSTGQRDTIKACGHKYRGRGEWPLCLSCRPGYTPDTPDVEEIERVLPVLQRFYELCLAVKRGEHPFDKDALNSDEILMRAYTEAESRWTNLLVRRGPVTVSLNRITLSDEVQVRRLKKAERLQGEWEMDLVYLNVPTQEEGYARPINPLMLILADEDSGMILDQELLGPDDDRIWHMINLLGTSILNLGRPRGLRVRNFYVTQAVEDLCAQCGIKLMQKSSRLPTLDAFLKDMLF